jgi:hypothetical protein
LRQATTCSCGRSLSRGICYNCDMCETS